MRGAGTRGVAELRARSAEPRTRSVEVGAQSLEREARSSEPRTRGSEPRTPNAELGARPAAVRGAVRGAEDTHRAGPGRAGASCRRREEAGRPRSGGVPGLAPAAPLAAAVERGATPGLAPRCRSRPSLNFSSFFFFLLSFPLPSSPSAPAPGSPSTQPPSGESGRKIPPATPRSSAASPPTAPGLPPPHTARAAAAGAAKPLEKKQGGGGKGSCNKMRCK